MSQQRSAAETTLKERARKILDAPSDLYVYDHKLQPVLLCEHSALCSFLSACSMVGLVPPFWGLNSECCEKHHMDRTYENSSSDGH
jgi:hypothetical protein